jgi:hypothetical protein
MTSQHLVTDLEKVSGVEEWILLEEAIGNGIGVWIERAGALQFQHLLVGLVAFRHQASGSLCNNNYASHIILSSKIGTNWTAGSKPLIDSHWQSMDRRQSVDLPLSGFSPSHAAQLFLHVRRNELYTLA